MDLQVTINGKPYVITGLDAAQAESAAPVAVEFFGHVSLRGVVIAHTPRGWFSMFGQTIRRIPEPRPEMIEPWRPVMFRHFLNVLTRNDAL